MSCENLVLQYSSDLFRLMLEENPDIEIYSTILELKASPFKASMTFHMHIKEEPPAPVQKEYKSNRRKAEDAALPFLS